MIQMFDWVVCKDATGAAKSLTVGKRYHVQGVACDACGNLTVQITTDAGRLVWFFEGRFEKDSPHG